MNPLKDDPDPTPAELIWWETGGHPPYKRLWVEGVDVTDRPISEWPLEQLNRERRSRAGRSPRR